MYSVLFKVLIAEILPSFKKKKEAVLETKYF